MALLTYMWLDEMPQSKLKFNIGIWIDEPAPAHFAKEYSMNYLCSISYMLDDRHIRWKCYVNRLVIFMGHVKHMEIGWILFPVV